MKNLLFTAFLLTATAFGQDIKLNGTVSAENNQIKNVADPTEAQDAVTKAYIDALIAEAVAGLQSQIDALQPSTQVTDIDGNTYDYLTYGDQVWTVENAEMVTYRDGTPIPQVTDNTEWQNLTTGAWCYLNNDSSTGIIYYNWYAVAGIHDNDTNTPNKELAPEGWHVPSLEEWTALKNYLITNGYNYDGTTTGNKIGKAMASITEWRNSLEPGWPGTNQSENNTSGFNALPEGYRSGASGSFFNDPTAFVQAAVFWISSEYDSNKGWYSHIREDEVILYMAYGSKNAGHSVRFVRD